jgi:hypothetical protein
MMGRWLERGAIVVASLVIAVGVIALLSGGLAGGRDDPGVSTSAGASAPGTAYRDQGDRLLSAGSPRPTYDSDPPTSGPHTPAAIHRNAAVMSDDQLLQALSLGDVVFLYSSARPPRGLQAVADSVAPRFTPALAADGQTVILARRAGLSQITALAWTRMLRSDEAGDLRAFANRWLGRGAGARAGTIVGRN